MRNIFAVTARRYPIVDEEAGAVLGLALFQRHPGVACGATCSPNGSTWSGQDPHDLRRDVLPRRRGDAAELAAVRRQLAGAAGSEIGIAGNRSHHQ